MESNWIHDEDLADILEKVYSNDLAGDFSCVLSEIPPDDFPANLDAVNDLFEENNLSLRVVAVRDSKDGAYYEWKIKL